MVIMTSILFSRAFHLTAENTDIGQNEEEDWWLKRRGINLSARSCECYQGISHELTRCIDRLVYLQSATSASHLHIVVYSR